MTAASQGAKPAGSAASMIGCTPHTSDKMGMQPLPQRRREMSRRPSQQRCSDACPQPAHAPRPARSSGWRWGVALVGLIGGGLLVFYGYERLCSLGGPALPRLGAVPAFTLIERSGHLVT